MKFIREPEACQSVRPESRHDSPACGCRPGLRAFGLQLGPRGGGLGETRSISPPTELTPLPNGRPLSGRGIGGTSISDWFEIYPACVPSLDRSATSVSYASLCFSFTRSCGGSSGARFMTHKFETRSKLQIFLRIAFGEPHRIQGCGGRGGFYTAC